MTEDAKEKRVGVELPAGTDGAGMRVDRFLRKMLPCVPLSHIHKMFRKRAVRRNCKRIKAADKLEANDVVKVWLLEADASRARNPKGRGGRRRVKAVSLAVLYEDEIIIAFDKPSGVAVHPGSGHPLETTVLGALRERVGAEGPFKAALVGRLDRDSSGVQMAGRSAPGVRALEEMQRSGALAKTYIALIGTDRLPRRGVIESPLLDSGKGRARMKVLDVNAGGALPPEAVDAVTRYEVMSRIEGASIVSVTLETARRHQIRAHLASIDGPLAGDVRYGDRDWNKTLAEKAELSRLFLHCAEAVFPHPDTGETVTVRSPLPADLARAAMVMGLKASHL